MQDTREDNSAAPLGTNLPVRSSAKVVPIDQLDISVTPLVRRAGRAPTQAALVRVFKAMKAAGIPRAWVHYPDGTKLEFSIEAAKAEDNTWADVA